MLFVLLLVTKCILRRNYIDFRRKNEFRRFENPKNGQKNILNFQPIRAQYSILGLVWPVPFDLALELVPKLFLFLKFFLFPIFSFLLFESMRISDGWAQSRDLSTDKQNRVHFALSKSTWSHFSDKKKNFNHTHVNGSKFSFLTSCQFPDLLMVFCESRT